MESIYSKLDDLVSYKNDWNSLAASSDNPMLYFDWFNYCVKHFHANDELFIFCIIDNDKLIAAAPLYRCNKCGKLKIIGNDVLYEPTSFLFKDNAALNSLFSLILNTKIPVELNRLPIKYKKYANSIKSTKYSLMRTIRTNGSQYIEDIGHYDNFIARLSPGRRSDLRRSLRKLGNIGDYRFDIYPPTNLETSNLLQVAFDVEKKCWKGEKKSAIEYNENIKGFILDIFRYFSNGNSLIGILYSNNTPIACNLSIRINDTLWVIKIGYDEKYRKCSPGILLTHNILKYCCDNDITNIEFLGSTEDWINLWRPNERKYMTLLHYPVSYYGLTILIKDIIKVLITKTRSVLE